MGIVAQQQLGIRSGYATATTCKVVAASLSDSDITFACGAAGFSDVQTTTTVAAGAGPSGEDAGEVASTTITGLSAHTEYAWTATQDGVTITGTLRTAPESGDDFCFYFGSCDAGEDNDNNQSGIYPEIRRQLQSGDNPPCAGLVFVDDHGYVAKKVVAGITSGSGGGTTYNLAVGYMSNFPLYPDENDFPVAFGRDADRDYVFRNINYFPQWGDWEFKQDFGWTSSNYPGADSSTWIAGYTAWDAFMKELMPTRLRGTDHTDPQGWSLVLGDVKIVSPDPITDANGQANTTGNQGTAVAFGSTQVDDVLTALNTDHAFKILAMGMGIRYVSPSAAEPPTAATPIYGAQQPLSDFVPLDYEPLIRDTGNTPPSLMDNDKTNGLEGHLFCLIGDKHVARVYRNEKPSDTGKAAESFMTFGHGHMNQNNDGTGVNSPDIVAGAVRDGTTVDFFNGGYLGGTPFTNMPGYFALRVDVFGSRHPKECHIHMTDINGNDIYSCKYVHKRVGNIPIGINENIVYTYNESGLDDL